MKILFSVHAWSGIGGWQSGAETTCQDLGEMLYKAGHSVKAILHFSRRIGMRNTEIQNGVQLFPSNDSMIRELFDWADVVITHLDYTDWTSKRCREKKKPMIFFSHNTAKEYEELREYNGKIGVIYNSKWMQNYWKFKHPSIILHPPTDPAHYDCKIDPWQNKYITLVNLNENKGGLLFSKLASRMPHHSFMGVKGSYDIQIIRPDLTNVKYEEQTPDIRSIIRQTKLLLCPSIYESWGKVASEFACSGVPVIASQAAGLMENLDMAGIFVSVKVYERWEFYIERLFNDEQYYKQISKNVKNRAYALAPINVISEFEKLCNLVR
jgi:glycosyltransferase involved in cell wall biosynthesis